MPPAIVIGLHLGLFNIWCWHQNPLPGRKKDWGGGMGIKAQISFAGFNVGGLPGPQPALVVGEEGVWRKS